MSKPYAFRLLLDSRAVITWAFGDFECHLGRKPKDLIGGSIRGWLGSGETQFLRDMQLALDCSRSQVHCLPGIPSSTGEIVLCKLVMAPVIHEGRLMQWRARGYWVEPLYSLILEQAPSIDEFIRMKCPENLKDDVRQSTLLAAIDQIEAFYDLPESTVRSKLAGIVLDRIRMERRREARREASSLNILGDHWALTDDERPSWPTRRDEDLDAIERQLEGAEDCDNAMVRLRVMCGLKLSQIADAAGSSISTVHRRIASLIKKIADRL